MDRDQGSAELLLMLGFVLILQVGLWQLTAKISRQLSASYTALDPVASDDKLEFTSFNAFEKEWAAPAPRIDFGADNQHEKDAEALCYIVSNFGCAAPGKSFRCN